MSAATIISRDEALRAGLRRYYTGQPCRRGHLAERRVSTWMCVECSRFHKTNPTTKAKDRAYYFRNAATIKIKRAAYHKAHAAKLIEQVRQWQRANPDKRHATRQRWDRNNPQKALAKVRNRRARNRAAEGGHSAADIDRILSAQRKRCAYCREPLGRPYHVDHIKALADGGSNHPSNLQITCVHCNTSKGARDPIIFAQSIGRLL